MISDLYLLARLQIKSLSTRQLLCFVDSREYAVRNLVIMEFHLRSGWEVFNIAINLISDKKYRRRQAGYLILGQLGTPERPFREASTPWILNGLKTEKMLSVQCAIATAIGHLEPCSESHQEIIFYLSQYLDKGYKSLQESVACAIGGLSYSEFLEESLIKRLKHSSDKEIREWLDVSLETIQRLHTRPA